MSAKMEQVEKNVVKLTIEVDAATFEQAMEKSYQKNKGRFVLQGFRKGKAPRGMIARAYGEEVFYEDAINFACPPAYDKAVEELGLEPVERPEIDIDEIGTGKALLFSAKVTVRPEVVLGQYKGLDVSRESVLVTDEDIEKELDRIRERNSRLVTVEDREVQDGDTLSIDFEGFVDGVAFEGGKGEDYTLVIGSGSFIPGFEEKLIGTPLQQEVEINVAFPAEYHSEELAGKDAMFKVTVKEIKYKEMPELDDEFAQDVSEFDTLEAYKDDIRTKLTEQANKETDRKFEEAVLKAAGENLNVEIPEVMVENQINGMLRQFDMNLRYQGMDLERYISMMGMDETKVRDGFRDGARDSVRNQLLLEAVVKAESIEADEAMVEEEIQDMSKQYGQSVEDIRKQISEQDMEHVKENACHKKAIRMMTESVSTAG